MPRPNERPIRSAPPPPHEGREGSFREDHPAYGCLEVHRLDGAFGPMYGSALPSHHGVIEFRVRRSDRTHSLGMDWLHPKEELVSWRMTYAAFVEMVAQMNRSGGVPITLDARRNDDGTCHQYPGIEWEEGEDGTEAGAAMRSAETTAQTLQRDLGGIAAKVREILEANKVPRRVRDAVLAELGGVSRTIGGLPFYLSQIREAGDKVVAAARTEVDAAISTAVRRLGFERLDELRRLGGREVPEAPSLPDEESGSTYSREG